LEPLYMPGQAGNPVDLGGRREGEAVDIAAATLEAVAADPQVDLLLCAISTAPAVPRTTADLADAAIAAGAPCLFFMWPGRAADGGRQQLLERGMPFADRLDDAIRALRAWVDWSELEIRPPEPRPAGIDAAGADALLAASPPGPLGEAETKTLLAAYGVPVNAGELATDPDLAADIADRLGYPVALKLARPNLIHKSDAGAVALNLRNEVEVWAAWETIVANVARHRPDVVVEAMLVQRMAAGDAEVIVGARVDPQFGPVVLVGAGGVLVELLHDVQLALAPIGPRAAEALLRRLRVWPVLAGVRGRPPLDIAAVADTVSRVSWLAWEQRARLRELDVNPLLVGREGAIAVDARAVVGEG
jgi:acetyl-CoA synthetase (ADP-forming)